MSPLLTDYATHEAHSPAVLGELTASGLWEDFKHYCKEESVGGGGTGTADSFAKSVRLLELRSDDTEQTKVPVPDEGPTTSSTDAGGAAPLPKMAEDTGSGGSSSSHNNKTSESNGGSSRSNTDRSSLRHDNNRNDRGGISTGTDAPPCDMYTEMFPNPPIPVPPPPIHDYYSCTDTSGARREGETHDNDRAIPTGRSTTTPASEDSATAATGTGTTAATRDGEGRPRGPGSSEDFASWKIIEGPVERKMKTASMVLHHVAAQVPAFTKCINV